MAVEFNRDSKLLFIGDSITDAGWQTDPERLGDGYVRMIHAMLHSAFPASAPQVMNRGVSGNKIVDLSLRWVRDVIDLRPDVVSIMIGINDLWHGLKPEWGPGVPIDQFRATYREILTTTRNELPECRVVLCEPTVIWPPQEAHANAALRPYVDVVNEIAREFAVASVVHLHDLFNRARERMPQVAWCPDGVHPSAKGHMLIATEWLTAAKSS